MLEEKDVRLDKWLWAVRIFKTRSIASEACKKHKVLVNDVEAKPSRVLHIGDIVKVKKPPVVYTYKVKGLLAKRQGPKIVVDYVENLTSQEELYKLETNLTVFVKRDRGAGRPTKKERRDIERLTD